MLKGNGSWGYGLLVHVEDGKIMGIQGDPDSVSRGYLCPKGQAHAERLYHIRID